MIGSRRMERRLDEKERDSSMKKLCKLFHFVLK